MTKGEQIAQAARAWLGTPYQDNAMVKGYGVDCAHLLLGSVLDAGLLAPGDVEIAQYSNEWHLHRSEEKFLTNIEAVAEEVSGEPSVGDFLLYQYGRCISHGAIYMGCNMVIHSYVGLGVILSEMDDVLFFDRRGRHRLRKIFRFQGVR